MVVMDANSAPASRTARQRPLRAENPRQPSDSIAYGIYAIFECSVNVQHRHPSARRRRWLDVVHAFPQPAYTQLQDGLVLDMRVVLRMMNQVWLTDHPSLEAPSSCDRPTDRARVFWMQWHTGCHLSFLHF